MLEDTNSLDAAQLKHKHVQEAENDEVKKLTMIYLLSLYLIKDRREVTKLLDTNK